MTDVGIVILNYKKYDETIACAESVLRQTGVSLSVAIVENGSGNASADILRERFGADPRVLLLTSGENLGYARGNNLGIQALRKKGISCILLANSDTVFSAETILRDLLNGYETGVGLLVPIIKNPDGTMDQRVTYRKKLLSLRMIKAILLRTSLAAKLLSRHTPAVSNASAVEEASGLQTEQYVVSGSAFVLTPDFFLHYTQLFPETFLYFEEWATILYLHKAKLLTKIIPCDPIIHKGGASTPDSIRKNSANKQRIIADSGRKVFKLIFLTKNQIRHFYSGEKP